MAEPTPQPAFLTDLRARCEEHAQILARSFEPLDLDRLNAAPAPRAWSPLACFEHLSLTHDYYRPRIAAAIAGQLMPGADGEGYRPSFWGAIYMHFAFNPRLSFPTIPQITPAPGPLPRAVLQSYRERLDGLMQSLAAAEDLDLSRSRVPIAPGIRFNLGDCLKISVYHDRLHIDQALRALAATESAPPA